MMRSGARDGFGTPASRSCRRQGGQTLGGRGCSSFGQSGKARLASLRRGASPVLSPWARARQPMGGPRPPVHLLHMDTCCVGALPSAIWGPAGGSLCALPFAHARRTASRNPCDRPIPCNRHTPPRARLLAQSADVQTPPLSSASCPTAALLRKLPQSAPRIRQPRWCIGACLCLMPALCFVLTGRDRNRDRDRGPSRGRAIAADCA